VTDAAELDRLCAAAGIERVYHDQFGARHEVPADTIFAISNALGLTGAQPRSGVAPSVLNPATIIFGDEAVPCVSLALPDDANGQAFEWTLVEENGRRSSGQFRPEQLALHGRDSAGAPKRRLVTLPHLPDPGYHGFSVHSAFCSLQAETLLVIAPRRAYLPPELDEGPGIWGLAVQLYALRSAGDWGIGDFGCLAKTIRHAAAAGAGAVGVNPLHALALDEPERASPYSPSSRVYLNPLYIEIAAVPDFAECEAAQAFARTREFAGALERLRAADLVDYRGVAALKLPVLALMHASFDVRHRTVGTARGRDFLTFVATEGEGLRRFCIFQALREARSRTDAAQRDWRNWPLPLRDPGSAEVAAFAARNARRIEFFAYCEWVARLQLAACAGAAREAGMPVGLYGDLAVGVDAAAGEAWATQDTIVGGWSMGAPPDAWNRQGQNWGLAPMSPVALRQRAYRPFIDLVRHNMRGVGALRIDHILGLWRSFWIRHGDPAAAGAYLRYPFAELIAILALESWRARCVAIGEDLGTVPPGLREALAAAGILSYRLLYFEHRRDGQRARAADYPRFSLVAVGTHDLPPLAAFWSGSDIGVRRALGQFASDEEADKERWRRGEERAALAALWREAGLAASQGSGSVPVEAAHRFLARTPGRIVMVQVEDALGLTDQVNVPGTIDEHPNWRRRLPLPVEAMFADARLRALAAAINEERPPARRRRR
jgi:4-alpha-glucanotransferase